jgi:hypothetical protein
MFGKRFIILVVIAVFLGGVVMGLGLNPYKSKEASKESMTIKVQGNIATTDGGLEIKPSQTSTEYPWDK